MQDLNRLIPQRSGWVSDKASTMRVNYGYGTIHGQTHAFLLTPEYPKRRAQPETGGETGLW